MNKVMSRLLESMIRRTKMLLQTRKVKRILLKEQMTKQERQARTGTRTREKIEAVREAI